MGKGIFRGLFFNRRQNNPVKQAKECSIEQLETRTFLSLTTVTSVVADNRGLVQITLSNPVPSNVINTQSVTVYRAGKDKIFGTADDKKVPITVSWKRSAKRITINANLPANTVYRVRLNASLISDENGQKLDGEFSGTFPSGNGVAGGNFEMRTKSDTSSTPYARMTTTEGTITLKLFRSQKPISVANFLSYANAGYYDNIFWTRSIPNFVIQGGSLRVNSSNVVEEIPVGAPIVNEFTTNGIISNTRGTMAFAKLGGNPNSATNQFFMNLSDNSSNLDTQNGGFTVFAKAANSSSLAVMDKIAGYATVALHNPANGQGVLPAFSATDLTDTPVKDRYKLQTEYQNVGSSYYPRYQLVALGGFNPRRDLIIIQRTALLMKVAKLS